MEEDYSRWGGGGRRRRGGVANVMPHIVKGNESRFIRIRILEEEEEEEGEK